MSHSSQTLIKNAEIYLENEIIENGYLLIQDGKIAEVGTMEQLKLDSFEHIEVITLNDGDKLIPGFVDVHIHGAGGADTMDGTTEALRTMAVHLPQEGTTSFLATTMTQSQENIRHALQNAAHYQNTHNEAGTAEVIGVHLEGPFINPDKKGAQPGEYVLEPNINIFKEWQQLADGTIKLVTVAPEMPNGLEFIQYLSDHGVTASIGHTDSTFAEVKAAAEAGATQVTHLYNGMRGLHHREPGTAGAALLIEELKVELISDGIHICPEMIQLAIRAKGKDGALLITDSMRAKCLKNGHYELGGQPVVVTDGKATLEDGTLAGSVLKMIDSVRNMLSFTDLTLHDIVKMASSTPAKQAHVFDRKGSIAVGKDADLVILNKDVVIERTICRGKLAYKKA
ncbi:N-acetylglucosamine-6-phosphate deacetylase [Bacillus sp. AGMB 02131]|uniref:N-acetylglucosamine-6-phosphate deacetylase n=1 Tax=Peribacillus faecalis TaxID=2772559 RepID=A0A927D0F5_9BACI|nr:N-acetylglucosamine-6-phosphate deacetylase [Peribacillus faecalis]MBD3108749.1 N-acetylglucosamine-6-phosphate deacetylase [Peribacillus faecalis]